MADDGYFDEAVARRYDSAPDPQFDSDVIRATVDFLEPGGVFVIEVGVPELQRLPPGETVLPFLVSENRWGFDEYDVANQGLVSHHFEIVGGRVHPLSVPFRRLAV